MVFDPLSACSAGQQDLLKAYVGLLKDVNTRINLISRKETADIFDRHIRHCLALSIHEFPDDSIVVDWGTGGGLPAIPLAIRFPAVQIVAVDSIGKKTRAVQEMGDSLGLENLTVWNGRAEQWNGKAHYSVSRATASLSKLWSWHKRIRIPLETDDAFWPAGLHCLKGGDLTDEIADLMKVAKRIDVSQRSLSDVAPGFPDKCLVSVVKQEQATR